MMLFSKFLLFYHFSLPKFNWKTVSIKNIPIDEEINIKSKVRIFGSFYFRKFLQVSVMGLYNNSKHSVICEAVFVVHKSSTNLLLAVTLAKSFVRSPQTYRRFDELAMRIQTIHTYSALFQKISMFELCI